MGSFEQFCGGPFWNQSLLQNNTWPELTSCFRSTLIVWAPCAYLWMATVVYVPYTFSKPRKRKLPFSALNFMKTLCAVFLIMLGVLNMAHLAGLETNGDLTPWAMFTGHLVEALTFALAISLTQLDRVRGVFTSGILFVFWTFMMISSVVPFYTYMMLKTYEDDLLKFILFGLKFLLICIEFLLHWVSDLPGIRRGYEPLGENPCPEVTASFPSRRIFWWMTRLVIRGYRKGIKDIDLWDLNPRDTCRTLVPPFESQWREEVKHVSTPTLQMKPKRKVIYTNTPNHSYQTGYTEKSPLMEKHRINIGTSASSSYTDSFEKMHDDASSRGSPSLFRVLWRLYGGRIVLMSILTLISDTLKLAGPLILSSLISFVSDKYPREMWWGYVLASSLLAIQLFTSVIGQTGLAIATVLGMNIKTTCISAVYKKALTLNNEAKKTTTTGEIVNLMSVDIQRVCDVMANLALLSSVPVQIIVSIAMIYQTIGASVFSGLAILLVLLPLNAGLSGRQRKLQMLNLQLKGERIKLLNEVLNGIKVLKLYAWETSFKQKVESVRRKEVDVLLKISYLSAALGISWTMAPFLVVLATFATYVLSDPNNQLDANKAFVTLSLFNILRVPMNLLPGIISSAVQAFVSTQRLNAFLCIEDLSPENVQIDHQSDYAVQIINGSFTWDRSMDPTLTNIDMNIREGALVAVVGQVASGKTSVISAILGEMEKISGSVTVLSSIGYVPQQAWIQNCSLRDNILFGKRWREKKYKAVIEACALKADLALLPAGDMTEIGEKGINLSGGQKQRVSLARAVYSNADIYLLDDPLSAVDSHVGKHIFKNVIGPNGLLHGKTRILVTHGVHWLPMVDHIIVMNDGRITEAGSYDQLITRNGHFAQFLQEYLIEKTDEEDNEDEEIQQIKEKMRGKLELLMSDYSSSDDGFIRKRRKMTDSKSMSLSRSERSRKRLGGVRNGMLTEEENVNHGKVKWGVFLMYGRAAGLPSFIVAVLLFLTYQVINSWAGFYLTAWTEDPRLTNDTTVTTETFVDVNYRYLGVYASFALWMIVVVTGYGYLLRVRMVRAAARLHDAILSRVFRSPMSFFDTTPYGRIINRLSRDVETIDNTLPLIIRMLLSTFSNVVATLVIITISTPLFISVLIPLVILYLCIQNFYIPTSRQLKRIESVTRSPVYIHFSETITGASSIRAYGAVDRFIDESKKRVDRNQVFYFAGLMANRWLAYYLDLITSVIIFASAIFAIVTPGTNGGIIGLSVSYALQVATSVSWMVRQLSDLETNIVSVERVKEYAELETEAPPIIANNRPPAEWPEYGRVDFINYMTRYRPGLDLVLKGLHCTIQGGEKVGIVGRTGAGKSTFTLALFRIIEAAGGSIVIDGINIADIGLHDVRSRLTILPQDPVLFSGTMRMNLDPFNEFSDDDIWRALDRAHLKKFVVDVPGQLLYECGEGGENLSVGQRQLVCLARALLRHTKVLVLDEATAAVDMETDSLIQKTIREAFDDCTIITIAHRLNTVMDYDKILVMALGQIQETGSPDDLLKDEKSAFHGMAKDAGLI
ncbi:multidrug resistance-associated protein 1-like [Haliotis cracherodii]|uniref:multidrug resistance-associated protein 1-like n=1 Tax=Haliotis cracherodii TaxID=6455 RepID=UPI0039EC82F4